jgi:hypothetical protein
MPLACGLARRNKGRGVAHWREEEERRREKNDDPRPVWHSELLLHDG